MIMVIMCMVLLYASLGSLGYLLYFGYEPVIVLHSIQTERSIYKIGEYLKATINYTKSDTKQCSILFYRYFKNDEVTVANNVTIYPEFEVSVDSKPKKLTISMPLTKDIEPGKWRLSYRAITVCNAIFVKIDNYYSNEFTITE